MVQQEDVTCYRCKDSCYGTVVNLGGNYYHQYCFTCKKCNGDLLENGYFELNGEFYCNKDYHLLSGTKCDGCGKFIEGRAVDAVDSSFHPECFGCHRCGKVFPEGANIIFDGEDFLCESCDQSFSPKGNTGKDDTEYRSAPPSYDDHQRKSQSDSVSGGEEVLNCCAGCGNDIKSGQALLALEKQWHLWCFTCHKCGCLLAGEYMGRDGVPYCEQDYQAEFGVTCAGCGGYITGKVLQAGEKHYHPHCSRCAKCGDMFGEGEEMYLQGSEIWHPHCSEEYQRENEELERLAEAENQKDPIEKPQLLVNVTHMLDDYNQSPSVETYSFGMAETQAPQRSPNITTDNKPQFNGYRHHKEPSNSSEGSLERRNNNEGSLERRNNNVWKPPSSGSSSYKPAGFRSIRPPELEMKAEPTPQADESDEDEPPPVPPPPSRSSSSAWKQKYNQPSGNVEEKRASGSAGYQIKTTTTNVAVSSGRYPSTSSSNESRDERGSNEGQDERDSASKSPVQKGVGFNKLQQRKMLKDTSLNRPDAYISSSQERELDPDIIRKLNEDPNGNTYYPYEVLKTNSYKTPPNVNHKILETYLTDSDFYDVFKMTRDKFYSLPKWRQEEMKRRVTLF